MSTTNPALTAFINDKQRYFDEISNEKSLSKLSQWLNYYDQDVELAQSVRTFTQQHLTVNLDTLLASCSDYVKLGKLYSDSKVDFWLSEPVFGPKIVARLQQIQESMPLAELLDARIVFFFGVSSHAFLNPLEAHIVDRIEKDMEQSKDFTFLTTVWKKFVSSSERVSSGTVRIKTLIDQTIAVQSSWGTLRGWFNEAAITHQKHTNDIQRKVLERMRVVLIEQLPSMTNPVYIHSHARTDLGDAINIHIDHRMAETIALEIAELQVDELIAYRKKFALHNWCCNYPNTRKVFKDRMAAVLPMLLSGISVATEVYPYIEMIGRYSDFDERYLGGWDTCTLARLCIDRFVELAPPFFTENPDLVLALNWYRYTTSPTVSETMEPICRRLIAMQTDPQILVNVQEREPFFSFAQKRFGILLQQMKASTSWFEEYISKKFFFGNKEIFLLKAKEFVQVA